MQTYLFFYDNVLKMLEAESQIKKLLEQTNYYILNAAITKNYIAAFGTGFIDLSKVYDKTEA